MLKSGRAMIYVLFMTAVVAIFAAPALYVVWNERQSPQ
jgi:hypothetical protein